jgi:hypothetical protein
MSELIIRFLIGGIIVSFFAATAEIFRPKSFAGLFGAAPSVALSTIGITILHHGKAYAAIESRSMIFGSIAFFLYATAASWMLMRFRPRALTATVALLPVWFGASFALLHLASGYAQ